MAEVRPPARSLVLERLAPYTQYHLRVHTLTNGTLVAASPLVAFHTTRDSGHEGERPGEGNEIYFWSFNTIPSISLGTSVSFLLYFTRKCCNFFK